MHILITGASGFIGRTLMKQCLDQGHYVIAQRRNSRLDQPGNIVPNYHWITFDIMDIKIEHLERVECIIHLAATGVSPRKASWEDLERINVLGTLHMCNLAKQLNARIVIAGTSAEYGKNGLRYDRIPPSAPLEPTFPYAVSKAAAYQLSCGFARTEKLQLAYLRVFNAFGIGQHELNLWPSLRAAAIEGEDFKMTPGEQIRDFISVESVSKSFLKASTELEIKKGEPIVANIGSGITKTVADFCLEWWKNFNAEGNLLIGALEYRDNEVMRFVPEIDKRFTDSAGT